MESHELVRIGHQTDGSTWRRPGTFPATHQRGARYVVREHAGPVDTPTAGHLQRRATAHEGAAEDAGKGVHRRAGDGLRQPSDGNREPGRATRPGVRVAR